MKSSSKRYIGIDISDASIEVAEMMRSSGELQIVRLERTILEPGVVERGRILNMDKLSSALEGLLKRFDGGIVDKEIVFMLPECQVYIKVLNLEFDSGANEQAVVRKELEKCIPINKDKLIVDHRKLGQISSGDTNISCILTASVDSEVLSEWDRFFSTLGLNIVVFDLESLAAYRWIHYKKEGKDLILIDLGAATTNISIFTSLGLVYNHTYFFAGLNISKKIADDLNIDLDEAEERKKKIGLEGIGDDTVITASVRKCIDQIIGVVKEKVEHYIEKYDKGKKESLKTVILLGGTSLIRGLSGYMKKAMPEFNFHNADKYFKDKDVSLYQSAIGAALRGMDKRWSRNDPGFYPSHKTDNNRKQNTYIVSIFKSDSLKGFKDFYSRNKKKLTASLIILLVLTFLAVSLIFIFGSKDKQDIEQEQVSAVTNIIYFELPLVLDGSSDGENSSWGRTIEVPRVSGVDNESATLEEGARTQLYEEESLWTEPLRILGDKAIYLVYNDKKLNHYIADVAGTILGRDNATVDDIVIKQMEEGRNNVYIAKGRVNMNLGAGESIEKIVPSDIDKLKRKRLKIREIGSQLNVRQDPGTNYAIVSKVDPGDVYPILEFDGTWIKIELNDGSEGWVYASYAEILN